MYSFTINTDDTIVFCSTKNRSSNNSVNLKFSPLRVRRLLTTRNFGIFVTHITPIDHCEGALLHFCISGSRDVFINGRPVCRQGDSLSEGRALTEGSKTVFANGYGVGRVGDIVSCSNTMKRGSNNVFSE